MFRSQCRSYAGNIELQERRKAKPEGIVSPRGSSRSVYTFLKQPDVDGSEVSASESFGECENDSRSSGPPSKTSVPIAKAVHRIEMKDVSESL